MIRKYGMMVCVALFAFLGGLAVNHHAGTEAQGMNRVFELRTYTTNESKLRNLLARFGGGEIDIFHKHGMTSIGYWVPDDPELSKNTMVYMLAHESRDAARASWQAFGADPDWATMRAVSQVDGRLVSHVESVFLNPTDFSPVK